MAQQKNNLRFAGMFEKVRCYISDRTALFGLIKWEHIVHKEKLDDSLSLIVVSNKLPTNLFINGDEYSFKKI